MTHVPSNRTLVHGFGELGAVGVIGEEIECRGQDESDGPLGVYVVGLVSVLPCFCLRRSAALQPKCPPGLVSNGTAGIAGHK